MLKAGVDKKKAEAAAKAVITQAETKEFVTKADLTSGLNSLRAELYKALAAQTIVTIGAIVGLLQIL